MNPRRLTRLEVRIARHAGDEALSAILELAHATITDPDFAGVERVETREPPPPRRLAAARRSEQHQALAGLDVERDAVHGVVRAEPFRHALEADSHKQAQYTPRL